MSASPTKITLRAGGETEIRPRGKFMRHLVKAFSRLMAASSLEPLDTVIAAINREQPGLPLHEAERLAVEHRKVVIQKRLHEESVKVLSDENLLYQLAADCIGQDLDWAEDELEVKEVVEIVRVGMKAEGVMDFLGESLTLPLMAAPGVAETGEPTTDAASLDESSEPSTAV